MDRPSPYGDDDGGGGDGTVGDRRTKRGGVDDGRRMMGHKNINSVESPPTSFYSKNDRDVGVSASPTSVAALFDLSGSAFEKSSTPFTDAYLDPRSVSPDSIGNGTPQLHANYHLQHEEMVQCTTNRTLKSPPPRSAPGAYFGNFGQTQDDIISRKIADFDRGPPPLPAPAFIDTTKKNKDAYRTRPIMIQIAPGIKARLRGSQETKACIARDFFIPALCYSCNLDIFCIMDANYVVCPLCRVVSPLDGGADMEYQGGVGLGFTFQDLMEWQRDTREIALCQQVASQPFTGW